jgi:alpha-mannosidase
VMISALKPADDDSGDLILRLWETRGGRTTGTVTVPGVTLVSECDALEVPNGESWRANNGTVQLTFNAFQIRTLRLAR